MTGPETLPEPEPASTECFHRFTRGRLALVYVLSLLLIGLIIVVDLHTEAEISLSVFYLLPVMLASWYGNRTAGIVIAVLSAGSWMVVDASEREYVHAATPYWEACARGATYLIVGLAISQLRRSVRTARGQAGRTRAMNLTLERRVEERTEELRNHVQELGAFTYTMAHDLRAPLRALHGFSDLLLQENQAALGESGKFYLERISKAARQMDSLILDLLTYARLIDIPVRIEVIEIADLVAAVLRGMKSELEERGAKVLVEEGYSRAFGQRALLAEVLRHLLSNAIRYVDGEQSPSVMIRMETRDHWIRVWVEDNGIGIPAEHRDRIFGPGERLNADDSGEGTGMGLAIARKAMERMSGRVGVESEPGRGSRFWIELARA